MFSTLRNNARYSPVPDDEPTDTDVPQPKWAYITRSWWKKPIVRTLIFIQVIIFITGVFMYRRGGTKITEARPNIVFIMTDDQDLKLGSLDYMPLLKKYITDEGTTYERHYCTTAICCPSRVSLLTGRNAHNTNITNVGLPYGGYPKFISEGLNKAYLPLWLQAAGYNTYYTGKLMNAHTVSNYHRPYPAGWTISDFFLDPYTYAYLNVSTQRNDGELHFPPVSWPHTHSTDVLIEKAHGLLDDALTKDEPFFLMLTPIAPHADIGSRQSQSGMMATPIPADRHSHLFADAKAPRTVNFNPENPTGASWMKNLKEINSTVLDYNDAFYRARLQTLQGVDELVEGVVKRLEAAGILDSTYIVYSSDNGYHIGQHRLPPGKTCSIEEDIHIPFMVRGPNITKGLSTSVITSHIDLAPTFLKIASAELREEFDGSPIPLTAEEIDAAQLARQEHVNVEFWGGAIAEGDYKFEFGESTEGYFITNNTYKSIRLISSTYDLYYSVWCTNEHELYEMTTDPGQLRNLYPTSPATDLILPPHQPNALRSRDSSLDPLASCPASAPLYPPPTGSGSGSGSGSNSPDYDSPERYSTTSAPPSPKLPAPLSRLLPRLDALLMVTKSCKAASCRRPWDTIHPGRGVSSLADALDEGFDGFYARAGLRVGFGRCALGYIVDAEGEQESVVFGGREL